MAIVKHTDPVGLASHDELVEAYRHALETDPVASFGGIVGVNRELDGATAREIAANSYEAVVAPGFSQAAIGILSGKAGLELLAVPPDPTEGMRDYGIANLDFKRVAGGLLVESLDDLGLDRGQLQVVTQRRPTLEELTDLLFAWRAVRHVRSNAIVLARNGATVGIGAGQASRQVSVEIALRRAGDRAKTAVMASRRLLPVPRRHPGGRRRRRDGDHPAGRLDPRRDGHRGRRPPSPGDGLHRPTSLPPLIDGARWNSCSRSRWSASPRRRRSNRRGSWAAARRTRPTRPPPRRCAGRWTRSSSPAGSSSARASATRRRCCTSASASGATGEERDDVPRSTSPSTRSRAPTSSPTARPARSPSSPRREAGGLIHAPDTYSRSSASGRSPPGKVDIRLTADREPRARSPTALGRQVGDITVVILERPRHEALIAEVRGAGARIKLISDGDLSAAISCAVSGTGVHAVMGIGGAPEGVITAAALRCLGGEIQARFRYRSDEERERGDADGPRRRGPRLPRPRTSRPGENLVFAATGVTAGDLLQGVRFFGGGARTHSLVMAYQTKQVRFVDTVHMFDRDSPPRVRL